MVEKIVAQLYHRPALAGGQYRNQFVVLRNQVFIGIDIDHFDRKYILAAVRIERLQHVIAQMAITARIENEMQQADY